MQKIVTIFVMLICLEPLAATQKPDKHSAKAPVDAKTEALQQLPQLQEKIEQLEKEVAILKRQVETSSRRSSTVSSSVTADSVTEPAPAQPGSSESEPSVLGSIRLSGFIDTYYAYNFNHPQSRLSAMRAFDSPDNQFSLNLAEVTLSKTPNSQSPVGFRLSLGFGNVINAIEGTDTDEPGIARYLEEGYISYLAPVGKGLEIDLGKFDSTFGEEVIETKDDWNYSRGLLFWYALPTYHFGLRARYPLSNHVALTGYLVNGWNSILDNNTGKTTGFSVAWTPTPRFGITQNYMTGPERDNTNSGWRQLSDTVFKFAPSHRLSFALAYDYGYGDHLLAGSQTVVWTGTGVYAKYVFDHSDSLAGRYEYYDDPQGFTTGAAQHINEVTCTFQRRVGHRLITRLEYRHDSSDLPSFFEGNLPVYGQNTPTAGVIYTFDARETN